MESSSITPFYTKSFIRFIYIFIPSALFICSLRTHLSPSFLFSSKMLVNNFQFAAICLPHVGPISRFVVRDVVFNAAFHRLLNIWP